MRHLLPALLASACALEPGVGFEREPIVSGEETDAYPAAVHVTRGGRVCSGTLVAPRTVLGAGHCLDSPPPTGEGVVYFGSDEDDEESGARLAIERTTRHPEVDLALMTLAEPAAVEPLPLDPGDVSLYLGEQVVLVGFGITGDLASDAGRKRQGWSRLDHTSEIKVYTGYDGDGAWTCHGDSGGPVILEADGLARVIGVASTGAPACGTPPNGHVRVDVHADWIGAGVLDDTPDLCAADGECSAACPHWLEVDPDCAGPAGCRAAPGAEPAAASLVLLVLVGLLGVLRPRRAGRRQAGSRPGRP